MKPITSAEPNRHGRLGGSGRSDDSLMNKVCLYSTKSVECHPKLQFLPPLEGFTLQSGKPLSRALRQLFKEAFYDKCFAQKTVQDKKKKKIYTESFIIYFQIQKL